jgi:LmbE family N-acetylglucosaminyl deacetylase
MIGQAWGMTQPLTLMAVHAHPDDEASSTGGVLALYSDQGVRTIVVTCTNGEFGDAPGGVKPGDDGHREESVAQLRLSELREAAKILGVSHLELLGYHDSGMPDWDYKDRPDAFCNVPLPQVAARIGAVIEEYRPQVVMTYDPDGMYQHPDHVHAARCTMAAVEAFPIPAKLYLTAMRGSDWQKVMAALRELGADVPGEDTFTPEMRRQAEEAERRITTTVDIRPVLSRKRDALFAHASQIQESWFSKLPPEIAESAFGRESFIRARDTTGAPLPEDDLLAGLR